MCNWIFHVVNPSQFVEAAPLLSRYILEKRAWKDAASRLFREILIFSHPLEVA